MTPLTLAIGAAAITLFLVLAAGIVGAFEGAVNGSTYERRRDRLVLRALTITYALALFLGIAWMVGAAVVRDIS